MVRGCLSGWVREGVIRRARTRPSRRPKPNDPRRAALSRHSRRTRVGPNTGEWAVVCLPTIEYPVQARDKMDWSHLLPWGSGGWRHR